MKTQKLPKVSATGVRVLKLMDLGFGLWLMHRGRDRARFRIVPYGDLNGNMVDSLISKKLIERETKGIAVHFKYRITALGRQVAKSAE